ncbi:uracil-DNA glycosylase [Stappia sp. F7233]|uniref:Type-5 uracil-DNA glycosylase n=1 Tax=Stappia albiluteola TaxID=2758565 RepID=A0A839ABZ1_9HYPH|nr:uracil-DNA glycosylase [Stappia albiluteola]MBA5776645.1 uracil-DNA glycosylase [Stappia albiluteola]
MSLADPGRDCPACPRLVAFRNHHRQLERDWFNAPVPTFAAEHPRLLVVGLAPGLRGANRTGRPFTGDYAGDLLYATLKEFGFAKGNYEARPDDGLTLIDAAITNAVRCVPPENKPTGAEIRNCRPFLLETLQAASSVKAVLALGRIAHDTVLSALELKRSAFPFAHQANHALAEGVRLFDSYHCSRYNTNTGRLTTEMFQAVFRDIRGHLDAA